MALLSLPPHNVIFTACKKLNCSVGMVSNGINFILNFVETFQLMQIWKWAEGTQTAWWFHKPTFSITKGGRLKNTARLLGTRRYAVTLQFQQALCPQLLTIALAAKHLIATELENSPSRLNGIHTARFSFWGPSSAHALEKCLRTWHEVTA